MSYQVFARKYRPQTFDDVLGQDHVIQTLKNAIEQNRLAHAYLFVGPRGTGKTSTARIFAKALNCPNGPATIFDPNHPTCIEIAEGRSLDVLEIDGASNNSVDQIRELRENVQFMPTSGQYRIFYIDEVHMLTKQAFNALLKTLEEPPAHAKFIFATTEAHKILPTILSRCQRFDLRPLTTEIIAKHLLYIAKCEGIILSESAAFTVAKTADGGMRDAQSMLDQLVSFCGNTIDEAQVLEIFGITSQETVAAVLAHLLHRSISPLLEIIHQQSNAGRDLMQFLGELIFGVREILISQVDTQATWERIPASYRDCIQQAMTRLSTDKLLRLVEILAETEERMKWATNKRLHLEIGLIKATHSLSESNISDIIRALNSAPASQITTNDDTLASVNIPVNIPTPATPIASTPIAPEKAAPLSPKQVSSAACVPITEPISEIAKQTPKQEEQTVHTPIAQEEKPTPILTPELDPIPASTSLQEPEPTLTSALPIASKKISMLDNNPVRPLREEEPENAEETRPLDTLTGDLFAAMGIPLAPPSLPEPEQPRINGDELWQECLELIASTSPLKHHSIEHTQFVEVRPTEFIVGHNPNDLMARSILQSGHIREKVEPFLKKQTGKTLSLSTLSTDVVPMPVEVELEPLPLPIPAPVASKINVEEERAQAKEEQQAQREATKAAAAADFYNDPLIQEALNIFQAKIID